LQFLVAVGFAGRIRTMPFPVRDTKHGAHFQPIYESSMLDRAIDDGTAEPCSSSSNLDGIVCLGFGGGGRCHDGHAESHNEEQHCLEKLHRGWY
jgi:hypothetical protein